jgi:penicillin-binding protein 1A
MGRKVAGLTFAVLSVGLLFGSLWQIQLVLRNATRQLQDITDLKPPQASLVYGRSGEKIGQFGSTYYQPVSYARLPKRVQQAFISAEDQNYWQHSGICLVSILRAMAVNLKAGGWVQGASTITQQLVRNRLLTSDKTLTRKLREMVLALALEQTMSKSRILELYLNTIFFGNGAFGIAAAAELYFGKSVNELDWGEAAFLAGLIRAPSRYNPFTERGQRLARTRQRYVLSRLVEDQALSLEQAEYFQDKPLALRRRQPALGPYGFAMFAVRAEVERWVQGLDWQQGGLRIETSLEPGVLQALEQASTKIGPVANQLAGDQEVGLVVLDAKTGGILGLRGGLDFTETQFNRVLQMKRPVGPMLLPFLYALALRHGFQLNHSLYAPGTIPQAGVEPTLYDGLINGLSAESARLAAAVGLGTFRSLLTDIGLNPQSGGFDLLMGEQALTPLSLAAAYTSLANGGRYQAPRFVQRVYDRDGRLLLDQSRAAESVLADDVGFIMAKVLQRGGAVPSHAAGEDQIQAASAYKGFDLARQNLWQVWFNPSRVVLAWTGSDSGQSAFTAEDVSKLTDIHKKFSRILVDETSILGTMRLKEPKGIKYHWIQTSTHGKRRVFLPLTTARRWP